MPTTYTSLLGLALPATGELSGTWGTTVNDAITSLVDSSVAGTTTLSSDADVTLTTTSGVANQARQAILLCNGARTAARNITAPATSKTYVVINSTTGGFGVVIRGAGPTTGVTIANGERAVVAWNGSDFVKISGFGGTLTVTDLTVTGNTILGDAAGDTITVNGATTFTNVNPTLSAGTANGVLYLNGSKVATSGSALVFDGTRLLVQTTSSNISSSERLTVNGLATTSTSSTTVPAIYAQNSDTTASTNQPYIYLHDGVASRAGLGVNYTDSALVLNGFGGIYFRYGGNGMGTTEGMRLTSTGLGIGTSSPTNKLTVNSGASTTTAQFTSTGSSVFLGLTNSGASAFIGADNTGAFLVQTPGSGYSTKLLVDSSGNVGIGTSSPTTYSLAPNLVVATASSGGLTIRTGSSNYGGVFFADGTTGDEQYRGYIQYNHDFAGATDYMFFGTAGGTKMTLDSSGNLGIGTSSPSYRLDAAITTSGFPGRFATNSGTAANDAGVLFQTIPSATAATRTAAIYLDANGANASGGDYFYLGMTGSLDAEITNQAAGPIIFKTTGTERARLDSTGNVVAGGSVALATTATDGFLYVPTCAGTPTGTPTAITGMAPIVVDTTNNKMYFYSGGAWRDAGP